jgi:hypothetical protein
MTKKQIIKISLLFPILALLFASCSRHETTKPYAFHNDVLLKTTPVKDQGKSELCWDYAMLATIETERLQLGDSVNLSPDYLARLWLQDQARTYYLTRGRVKVTLRGMMPMTLHLMERYGIQPFDSYHPFGAISYIALTKASMQVARASTSLRRLDDRLGDLLDKQIGYLPPTLFMLGMGYTPKQFAQSIYLPGNYVALTSFTHHPFGKPFVMESPDNRMLDSFYNIPIDQLMKTIISTLRHGHPVCWEGDISESGFDFYRGIAVLTNEDHKTTQQERQRAFEQFQTTDDHCMELCGLAHDRHGRLFFIAKNSWGTQNPYGGFMYLSYNYVRMKTIGVMVKR